MTKLIIGLVSVMLANILMGSSLAKLRQEWNKELFLSGIYKLVAISIAVSLMYLASYLNPNILVATINETNVNLIEGMKLIFIAGIIYYGAKDLMKLRDMLQLQLEIYVVDPDAESGEMEEVVVEPKEEPIEIVRE